MVLINFKKYIFSIIFILCFIFIYFSFIILIYGTTNNIINTIILFSGFSIIILAIFICFNLNHEVSNTPLLKFKFLSENYIKIILASLLLISLSIPPITSRLVIITWKKVEFANFLRAIIVIIVIAFLPGANFYNIFFSNTKLEKKYDIEPFLLKLTIYPIISFAIIGISTMILDRTGLPQAMFYIALCGIIYSLFILDFIIQNFKNNKFKIFINHIEISKYTLIILLISVGFILISISVIFAHPYLTLSDSWAGISQSRFIGIENTSPISRGETFLYYPIFWCYIIFGFSSLGGIPFINMNLLFAPFSYLFVTSVYLLMKSILINLNNKYSVISTIIMVTFSGLFYIISESTISSMTYVNVIYMIYKSYSIILFLLSLSIFVLILKTVDLDKNYSKFKLIHEFKDSKLICLSAFFLILSLISYMIPFLIGFIFIVIYCFISKNKIIILQILSFFILLLTIFYIMIDLLMMSYLSLSIFYMIQWIIQFQLFVIILSIIAPNIIIYAFFVAMYLLSILNWYIYVNYFMHKQKKLFKFKLNSIKTFKIVYTIFSIFLIIEIIVIILAQINTNYNLYEDYIFFNYIHEIFTNIGYVGISAFYFSFFCFKKNKPLFVLMIIWILFTIIFSSIIIYLNWAQSFAIKINSIDKENYNSMYYWFKRIWVFSVIPFSILFTIGLFEFIKYVKNRNGFKKILLSKKKTILLKYSTFSLFIFLFLSSFFIFNIKASNIEYKTSNNDIEMLSWISENIPEDSKVLLDNEFTLRVGTYFLANSYPFLINDIFESEADMTERMEEIGRLKDNNIEYFLISKGYFNENSNLTVFINIFLIPNFYNKTLKEYGDLRLYYAPYFD